jgi:hypothetical protein
MDGDVVAFRRAMRRALRVLRVVWDGFSAGRAGDGKRKRAYKISPEDHSCRPLQPHV